MSKIFIVMSAVAVLSGCSLVAPKVGPEVAKAVNKYCMEPLAERQLIRSQVNALIVPNTIKVTCAGDPE